MKVLAHFVSSVSLQTRGALDSLQNKMDVQLNRGMHPHPFSLAIMKALKLLRQIYLQSNQNHI